MPSEPSTQVLDVQGMYVQSLPALRSFVLSLVPDSALADDVVQETFLTVTQKADHFQRGTNFRAWAWTIARFKVLQMLERRKKRADRFSPEVIEALCADEEAAGDWGLEQQLEHLNKCVEHLAPRTRQAVTLRYELAHRPPEIARLMGWTVDAVNVALSRARNALRKCVDDHMSKQGG
jgi:RNA polymerase sigma-70 factor (ECF subfamily)